jgi:disulfide bond formation protein DsbB
MTPFASTLIYLMAIGTALLDVALVVKVLALFHKPSRTKIMQSGQSIGLLAIFILSTLAVLGTLYMQYFAGLNPCLLCWYQRVFMYPIPVISLIALIKGETLSDMADYILTLSFLGGIIALYQHLLQILPSGSLIPCDASDDCAIRSVFYFHFVTLPWMALTVFVAIFLIALLARLYKKA